MKRQHQQLLTFLLLAALFIILAATSWRRWPDVFVDYGLQLYTPWQLAEGKVLYRDVMYLAGGPLSQHFHAVMFKLFGASFTVLILTNLTLLGLFLVLLHRMFSRAADALTAGVVCASTLAGFAFAQYGQIGNYNFITPYTYETFQGLLLSVAAIGALWQAHVDGRKIWPLMAGVCAGGVFLTKPDLFFALGFTLAASALLHLLQPAPVMGRGKLRGGLLFLSGFLLPNFAFAIYYTYVWDATHALQAVTAAWLPVLTTPASQNKFYQWCLGLDRPASHLLRMAKYSGGLLLGLAFLSYQARHFRRRDIFGYSLNVLLVVMLYLANDRVAWRETGCALLPATALGSLFVAVRWWQLRRLPEGQLYLFPFLWSVFALFLMAKMGLFTRLYHYGFYLALPAFLFVVLFGVWLLPRELQRFGVHPKMLSGSVIAFLAIAMLQLAGLSHRFYSTKTEPVGEGHDLIFAPRSKAEPEVAAFRQALIWIQENTAPAETLAVMPHGVLLNYLSRRANPTPFVGFTLPEIQAYGEMSMLHAYREHRPDYIALVHCETAEYGVKYFGQAPGYGYELMQWVRTNYTPVWLYGHEPLQTNAFGVQILKRNNQTAGGENESL